MAAKPKDPNPLFFLRHSHKALSGTETEFSISVPRSLIWAIAAASAGALPTLFQYLPIMTRLFGH